VSKGNRIKTTLVAGKTERIHSPTAVIAAIIGDKNSREEEIEVTHNLKLLRSKLS
jgi:hypothetical protein